MVGNGSFKVGLYIRLSRDDGNIESDSIVSQRSLLNQYVKENNYIVVDEYVDDGFSGTNFDRPSFKKMIKDMLEHLRLSQIEEYSIKYPQYGFERNSGYGTKEHIEKIKEIGSCPIHRKTFIKNFSAKEGNF